MLTAYLAKKLTFARAGPFRPARRATGSGRLTLAWRDVHPLDDTRSFMKASHPPLPFDQQGLVALKYLYVYREWLEKNV